MLLKTSSASQIGTFGECEEHWFAASVLKIPTAQSPYAVAGDEAHKALEDYSTLGTEPAHPSSKIAIQWLAPPKTPGVFIESWLQDPPLLIAGLHIRGRMDYFDARSPALPAIRDFKSKKKFDRYMKTRRTLLKDTQMNVYAAWALAWSDKEAKEKGTAKAEAVAGAHIYILRAPEDPTEAWTPDARFVDVDFPRETVNENIAALVPTLERMKEVAAGTVKPTRSPAKCRRWFGGDCPFLERCWPDENALFDYFMPEVPDMPILDTLKASPGAASIPDPAEFVGRGTATPPPESGEAVSTALPAEPKTDIEEESALLKRLREM